MRLKATGFVGSALPCPWQGLLEDELTLCVRVEVVVVRGSTSVDG